MVSTVKLIPGRVTSWTKFLNMCVRFFLHVVTLKSELKLVKTNIIPKNQLNHLYGGKGTCLWKSSKKKSAFARILSLLFLSLAIYKKKVYQTRHVKYVLIDLLPSDLKDHVRFTIGKFRTKNFKKITVSMLQS